MANQTSCRNRNSKTTSGEHFEDEYQQKNLCASATSSPDNFEVSNKVVILDGEHREFLEYRTPLTASSRLVSETDATLFVDHSLSSEMAGKWDVVNTEWDTDQETVNFGTRQCVVVDAALFDVVTLATVECTEPGSKSEPKVCGSLWEQYTVLVVDGFCHILTDSCEKVLKSFALGSHLSCLNWSDDGKFLFLVTEVGHMSVIYMPDSLLVVTLPLPNFNHQNKPVNISLGRDEVMILSTNGTLMRIIHLDLELLASALSQKNNAQAAQVQSKMRQEVVECLLKTEITAATVIEDEQREKLQAIGTAHGIFLWDYRKNAIVTGAPLGSPLKQIQATGCNKFILTLDAEGRVVCYDRNFLLPVYHFGFSGQFVLFELDKAMKRTLTTDLADIDNRSIVMRTFLGTDPEYKVAVSDFCCLLSSSTRQNDIVFVEGARDGNGNVVTLRIRKMAEGRPVDRLRRLIARGRFEEGIRFANNFDLDVQVVYTAKAIKLSQGLSVWSNTKADLIAGMYQDFIATLDSIKDLRFVIECSLKFAPSSAKLIRDTLAYARKRLALCKSKEEESDRLHYVMEVCSVQEKLNTFELIYGSAVMNYWYDIDMKDMFNTLIEILNNEEMASALILWQRHSVEIVTDPSFAEEETVQLLGSIPNNLKSDELVPWLQLVLPSIVQFDRDRIPLVVDWIVRKAASLEIAERKEWPRNALKFADTLLGSLKAISSDPEGPMEPLFESIHIFNELVILYENYKIPITFNKFTQENTSATINMLLNWLPTAADVGPFLDVFLLPFMRRRALDIDESIYTYILNLLHNSVSWWHSGQAQWERIVSTLITYIKSVEVQAKSILAALCQAPVPWSETITEMAEKGKKLEHPLAHKIKEEHKMVPLKTVLRHYNIHIYDLTDTLLMDCIVRNILKQQTDECLEHALVVAQTIGIRENHVRTTYVTSLLCSEKPSLVVETLGKMSKDEQITCSRKLLFFIEGSLNSFVRKSSAANEKRARACMGSLNAVWECYQAASGETADGSLSRRVVQLRNIFQLMEPRYGVAITSNDYCHRGKREEALRKFCIVFLQDQNANYTRLSRVAHLLSLSEAFALQEHMLVAQSAGHDDVMIVCAQRLLVCPEDSTMAEACYLAAQCLNRCSRANDTIDLQSKLAAKAATYCSDDCLLDITELCRLVNLRYLIQKRSSEMGVSPDILHSVSSLGVYQDFTTPILNRDIMKHLSNAQTRVLPFVQATRGTNSIVGLSARIPVAEAAEILREFAKDCLSVILVLRGCRQLMPALYMAYASDSLVQLLFSGLPNLDLVTVYNKTIAKHFDELSSQLLVRVMTANRPEIPDMALATSCLLILGPQEGYKYLVDLVKRSTSDRRRVFYVGFLGRLLFKLSAKGGEEEGFFDSVLLRCHWSMKLAPYGVHVQIPPSDEMLPIMETLVSLEDVPLDILSSFCNSFHLNANSALALRASFLITSTDAANLKKRLPKIEEVLSQLSPAEVQKTIASVRFKVSPYNYELLTCLLNVLLQYQPDTLEVKTMLELLEFLACYERCTPPSVSEQHSVFFRLPGSEDWPTKRLPMYYQIDSTLAKNIYHEEFHVSNWNIWYNSPSLIPINPDEICMLAVTNTVKVYKKESYDNAQIETLFQKIKQCLDCVSSVSRAACCAGDITQRLSTSPEHFFAALLHMQLCERWKDEGDPTGIAAFKKSAVVHQRVQTEESLAYYKLKKKRYDALIPYPERLVRSLFEDCTADRFQDINKAAEDIAQIFDLNLKVLKHAMMVEWLPPIEQYQQEDFYAPHGSDPHGTSQDSNVDEQNRTNLQRVACLLNGADCVSWIAFLREKALNDDERPAVRVRALTALREALNDEQMMEHMELTAFSLEMKIKLLNFLSRLEFLGLVYREDEFEVTDKADLVRGLLQSGGGTQRCITLAMDLATYNVIQDADIWANILEKIVKFNMLETAHRLIKDTSEIRLLWVNPVMAPVWNIILQAPFKQSNGDADRCVSALQLLWSCPILDDIDLEALEKCVLAHDFPFLGALLLPFVKEEKRPALIQELQTYGSLQNVENKLMEKCQRYPYIESIKSLLKNNA